MDIASRLAFKALILGLQRSGQLSAHALLVINDELRLAAREAHDMLFEQDAETLEAICSDISSERVEQSSFRMIKQRQRG